MTKNINFRERSIIECMLKSAYKLIEISRCIGRSYKTIKREVGRCFTGNYNAHLAQQNAAIKMSRAQHFTLSTATKNYIDHHLIENKWSPMIISKRLFLEGLQVVSHSYIYQYIATDKKQGGNLYQHLTHAEGYSHNRGYKGSIENRVSIHERPLIANDRQRVGDVEIDLIVSPKNQGASIISVVDRKSRYCALTKTNNKTKERVAKKVVDQCNNIAFAVQTITSDNGTEFSAHENIANTLKVGYYFADPYASYQRGSIEQLNGLVRRFIPKGTAINTIDDLTIKMVEDKLNKRPRKVLEWKSPIEYLVTHNVQPKSGRLRV